MRWATSTVGGGDAGRMRPVNLRRCWPREGPRGSPPSLCGYSAPSEVMGSARDARHAGTGQAATATATSVVATTDSTTGSRGDLPWSTEAARQPRASAISVSIATPTSTTRSRPLTTSRSPSLFVPVRCPVPSVLSAKAGIYRQLIQYLLERKLFFPKRRLV